MLVSSEKELNSIQTSSSVSYSVSSSLSFTSHSVSSSLLSTSHSLSSSSASHHHGRVIDSFTESGDFSHTSGSSPFPDVVIDKVDSNECSLSNYNNKNNTADKDNHQHHSNDTYHSNTTNSSNDSNEASRNCSKLLTQQKLFADMLVSDVTLTTTSDSSPDSELWRPITNKNRPKVDDRTTFLGANFYLIYLINY